MKAAAKALEAFPAFNSSLSDDGESLILKNMSILSRLLHNGLVVPVFKDVNKKGIYELSEELMVVSKKARAGKLTAADMQGGCYHFKLGWHWWHCIPSNRECTRGWYSWRI